MSIRHKPITRTEESSEPTNVFLNSLCLLQGHARNGGYMSKSSWKEGTWARRKCIMIDIRLTTLNADLQRQTIQCRGRNAPHGVMHFLNQKFWNVCACSKTTSGEWVNGDFPNLSNLSQVLSRIFSEVHSKLSTLASYTSLLSDLLTLTSVVVLIWREPADGILQLPSLFEAADPYFIWSEEIFFHAPDLKRTGSGLVLF